MALNFDNLNQETDQGIVFGNAIGDDVGDWIDTNIDGENDDWDYSDLNFTFETEFSVSFSNPVSDEFFPSTNLVWKERVTGSFGPENLQFFFHDEFGAVKLGSSNNSQGIDQPIESDYGDFFHYTYAGIDISDADYSTEIVGSTEGFYSEEEAARSVENLGYGFAAWASYEFEDAELLKISEIGTRQSYNNGTPIGPLTKFDRTLYEIWVVGIPIPIAVFKEETLLNGSIEGTGQTFYEAKWMLTSPLSVDFFPEKELSVYPNPASDQVTIRIPAGLDVKKVSIITMEGKEVLAGSEDLMHGDFKLSTSDLDAGIYLVRIESETDFSQRKLMVLK